MLTKWRRTVDKTKPSRVPEVAGDDTDTAPPCKPLGQWLMENMPQGVEIELPDRSSNRPIPFVDEEGDE